MRVANIDRTGPIGWFLLRLSFSLGMFNLVWVFPKSAFGAEPAATTTVLVYNQAGVSRSILAAAGTMIFHPSLLEVVVVSSPSGWMNR